MKTTVTRWIMKQNDDLEPKIGKNMVENLLSHYNNTLTASWGYYKTGKKQVP